MVNDGRLRAAYESCAADARAHYENFPVASILIPRSLRHHVAAVYAFARAADDFADEGQRPRQERQRLLQGWLHRLRDCVPAPVAGPPPTDGEPANSAEIFLALGASIRDRVLPLELFEDLLTAFAQDVVVTRYDTWEHLLDYCGRSANPVGRLVLRIAGYRDARLDGWSDAICTGLQLANFWQDLAIDFSRGRLYVPTVDLERRGASESDLAAGIFTSSWRDVLSDVVSRTRALFAAGRPLCEHMRGRLRYELRATWLGGTRVLDRLERHGFDAIHHRPTLGARDLPWLAWRMTTWTSATNGPEGALSHKGHEDVLGHEGHKVHKVHKGKNFFVIFVLFVASSSLWPAWLAAAALA